MPFHQRHEISYHCPTQCCGWVSSVGQKKLPFISAVKCEELSAVSQAGSCGVWNECVSQVLRTLSL